MSQRDPSHGDWCRRCQTQHAAAARCPGELLASAPERQGWRVMVKSARGTEVIGTLVAPSGSLWRARILTFPRTLWGIPGIGTMKFVGRTPGAAEKRAIDFIRQHCARHGMKTATEAPAADSGRFDAEREPTSPRAEPTDSDKREVAAISVRFGLDRPTTDAETDDLSKKGLFIRTSRPLPVGQTIRLFIWVKGMGIPLRGVVRWTRTEAEEGRAKGMGVELTNPHAQYLEFCREMQTSEASETEPEPAPSS